MSQRVVTEDLAVSLVEERSFGALHCFGERQMAPCDALGGQERGALPVARMCTAVCVVGVGRALAAVGTGGGDATQRF